MRSGPPQRWADTVCSKPACSTLHQTPTTPQPSTPPTSGLFLLGSALKYLLMEISAMRVLVCTVNELLEAMLPRRRRPHPILRRSAWRQLWAACCSRCMAAISRPSTTGAAANPAIPVTPVKAQAPPTPVPAAKADKVLADASAPSSAASSRITSCVFPDAATTSAASSSSSLPSSCRTSRDSQYAASNQSLATPSATSSGAARLRTTVSDAAAAPSTVPSSDDGGCAPPAPAQKTDGAAPHPQQQQRTISPSTRALLFPLGRFFRATHLAVRAATTGALAAPAGLFTRLRRHTAAPADAAPATNATDSVSTPTTRSASFTGTSASGVASSAAASSSRNSVDKRGAAHLRVAERRAAAAEAAAAVGAAFACSGLPTPPSQRLHQLPIFRQTLSFIVGQGGMGFVVAAKDDKGKLHALKTLDGGIPGDPSEVAKTVRASLVTSGKAVLSSFLAWAYLPASEAEFSVWQNLLKQCQLYVGAVKAAMAAAPAADATPEAEERREAAGSAYLAQHSSSYGGETFSVAYLVLKARAAWMAATAAQAKFALQPVMATPVAHASWSGLISAGMHAGPGGSCSSGAGLVTLLKFCAAFLDKLGLLHGAGISHHDIKPDNVLVIDDGAGGLVPVLGDLGIAFDPKLNAEIYSDEDEPLTGGTPGFFIGEASANLEEAKSEDLVAGSVSVLSALTGLAYPFKGGEGEEPTPHGALAVALKSCGPLAAGEDSLARRAVGAVMWTLKAALHPHISSRPASAAELAGCLRAAAAELEGALSEGERGAAAALPAAVAAAVKAVKAPRIHAAALARHAAAVAEAREKQAADGTPVPLQLVAAGALLNSSRKSAPAVVAAGLEGLCGDLAALGVAGAGHFAAAFGSAAVANAAYAFESLKEEQAEAEGSGINGGSDCGEAGPAQRRLVGWERRCAALAGLRAEVEEGAWVIGSQVAVELELMARAEDWAEEAME
jgi:hypothetical protein